MVPLCMMCSRMTCFLLLPPPHLLFIVKDAVCFTANMFPATGGTNSWRSLMGKLRNMDPHQVHSLCLIDSSQWADSITTNVSKLSSGSTHPVWVTAATVGRENIICTEDGVSACGAWSTFIYLFPAGI